MSAVELIMVILVAGSVVVEIIECWRGSDRS